MAGNEENEIGVEDLLSLINKIQENQTARIKRLVGDYASSFNLTEEQVLRKIFPDQVTQIAESSSAVRPKYVNPNNPNETWAGRGKTPLWMEPYLHDGQVKEDFLIKDA